MYFYASIGDIRDKIENYTNTYHKGANFPDILREIFNEKPCLENKTPLSDIRSLLQMDDELFLQKIRDLYFRFPKTLIYDDEHFDVVPSASALTVINQFFGTRSFIHLHDCFEIDYIFRGECELSFLDEKRVLTEGDFCILSPYTNHDMILLTKDSCIFPILIKEQAFRETFFSLLSGGDLLSDFFKKILSDSAEPNYLLFKTNVSYEVRDIMKRLFLEKFRYDKYVDRCTIYWLNLLFTNILRNYQTYSQFSSYKSGPDYAPILRYIQSHYDTITLPRLSEIFHYSVPYLSKIIKKSTGKNFKQLVNETKMRKAIYYLEETDFSIEDISGRVGYSSSDHFYHVFRKAQGMSPQQYRKNYLENA